jgi:hypothetical protein
LRPRDGNGRKRLAPDQPLRASTLMRKNLVCFLVAAAIVAPLVTQASAESWKTYHNARFGTTADVPADWQPGRPPDNDDGLVFTSADGRAHLTVSGGLNIWDSIAEAMAIYEEPRDGATVTYKQRGTRSITLSGTRGDVIFYEKHILSCRDQVWNSIYLEYPASRRTEFDQLVAHIARSLREGISAQVEACNK